MIDVSYGILHYNPDNDEQSNAEFTKTVASLIDNRNHDLNIEIFIIDQGNPFKVREFSRQIAFATDSNFISLNKNVGISRGINTLARVARGKYISLVTSDTLFSEGLDTLLIRDLENNPKLMQVCPVSNNASSEYQKAAPGVCVTNLNGDNQIIYYPAQELTIQFWKREIFDKIGYFDERWKACYENLDFALRILLSGNKVGISQDAYCGHSLNMTTKNGSINKAYDGYIDLPNGIDHSILGEMFDEKWPNMRYVLYGKDPIINPAAAHNFKQSVYLPFLQEVNY